MRPAMSFALTFSASTSFFTLDTSPLRQASKRSLKAPYEPPPPPLLLLLLAASPLPESGVEPGLDPLPSVVVGELALLLVLLLLLAERARAGEAVGDEGAASPSAWLSNAALRESEVALSVGAAGQPGGVAGREEPRGGEESGEFGCCC